MPSPLSQDYNEAIQSPTSSFVDPELCGGQPVTNALGMPMPRSGNFADVYEFVGASGVKWAVKCFTREVPGLQDRYGEISKHLQQSGLPFTVDFKYLEKGIRIRGQWYPVLKMQWVDGFLLNEFVRNNLDKPALLDGLSQIWVRMGKRLREAGMAHADLQHGNVILVPGSKAGSLAVKLIDYDGMFVPAFASKKSGELGHPNYQHPQRFQQGVYNAEVDRLPLLAIACALRALVANGRPLWDRYDNGDNLLFREIDLRSPAASPLLKELWNINDVAVHDLTGHLVIGLTGTIAQVPVLQDLMNGDVIRPLSVEQEKQIVGLLGPSAAVNRPPATATAAFADPIKATNPVPASAAPIRRAIPSGSLLRVCIAAAVVLGLLVIFAGIGVGAWLALIQEQPHKSGPEVGQSDVTGKEKILSGDKKDIPKKDALPKERQDPPRDKRDDLPKEGPPKNELPKKIKTLPKEYVNGVGMKFALVPKGKSWLGGGGGKPGNKEVVIPQDFYLGVYEVSQEEWQKVMANNPSNFKAVAGISGDDQKRFPVEQVSWDDAQMFLAKLNERDKQEGWVYRLPKEVEWEYASRGGPMTDKAQSAFDYYFDKPTNSLLPTQANFQRGGGLNRTCKVGSFAPTPLGLYDMHGNVWEWLDDAQTNRESLRMIRGGSWTATFEGCTAANRPDRQPSSRSNDAGLRVARVPVATKKNDLPKFFTNTIGMKFTWIPSGTFTMGSPRGENQRREDEVAHKVTLTKGFYLAVYTTTQEEWQAIMGSNPAHFKGQKNLPVEMVSWDDCQVFIKKLREKEKKPYRLPTEAEWEYACRAGTTTPFSFGGTISTDQANYNGEHVPYGNGKRGVNRKKTTPVGSFPANAFGLHDMHGNLWQWCQDWYGDYPEKEVIDPQGPNTGKDRVLRGGSWYYDSASCRSAYRHWYTPSGPFNNIGFRICVFPD